MNYILHILLAMGTLALAWGEDPAAGHAPPWTLLALAASFATPYVFVALARRSALRGRMRLALVAERIFVLSPIAIQALAVGELGWLTHLARWTGLSIDLAGWPSVELLLALVPYTLGELAAIDAGARLNSAVPEVRGRVRRFQLRFLASAFAPFGLYLAISGAIGASETMRVLLEEVDAYGALSTLGFLALFVLVVPRILTSTWDTAPLREGPLRDLLESVARSARFRCRGLFVWSTESQMANAAIVGFTPGTRAVLFSDVLLRQLQPLEVAAVFGHEMGHARRHHAAIFAAYTLAVLLAADVAGATFAPNDFLLSGAIFVGGVLVWLVSFTFLSRRFELEADLESVAVIGSPVPLITALQRVSAGRSYSKKSWRHFSTEQRVRFLAAAEANPEVASRLRRKLRVWARVGFVLLAVTLAAQAVQLASTWDEGHVVAELRLGKFEDAAARFGTLDPDEVDEGRLEPLVSTAADVPDDARDPASLEALALAAFASGDDSGTLDYLELAYLRGNDRVGDVLGAIEARRDGEPNREAESRLDPSWRSAIERRFDGTR